MSEQNKTEIISLKNARIHVHVVNNKITWIAIHGVPKSLFSNHSTVIMETKGGTTCSSVKTEVCFFFEEA